MVVARSMSWRLSCAMVALAWLSPIGRAACQYMARFAPVAILNNGLDSARIEIVTPPGTSSVHWRVNPAALQVNGARACGGLDFQLFDDGTHGDRLAGDGVFTVDKVQFDPTCPVQTFPDTFSDPQQSVAGVSILFPGGSIAVTGLGGTTTIDNPQPFLRILDSNLFSLPDGVTLLAPNLQAGSNVLNLIDEGYVADAALGLLPSFLNHQPSVQQVTASLYSYIPDTFDIIELLSTARPLCTVSVGSAGIHMAAQVAWTGTGQGSFNFTSGFGSAGRLLGVNLISGGTGFGTSYLHFHETMHTWGAYLNPSLGLAPPPGEVGGFGPSHWGLNNSIAGAIGGCYWTDNGDGTFTSQGRIEDRGRFPDLEMYLMGLIPASQAGKIFVAQSISQQFCVKGTRINGPFKQVSIGDITAIHGVRTPGPDTSQKQFHMAVVVTTQGRLLTPLEITLYNRVAAKIQSNFTSYTGGLAEMITSLDLGTNGMVFTSKNSASYAVPPLPPETIVLGEAPGIAPALLITDLNPWPMILGGVHLEITDSQQQTRSAPIYFVSSGAVGFQIPAGTAPGNATTKLTTSTGATISGTLEIGSVSPGLFTANATGSGAPAGFWVRVSNGVQTLDYLFDATKPVGSRDPVLVDLGPPGDQVFLSLYGTGFRGATSVAATVGGVSVPVSGFDKVAAYQGEDIVNVGPLPRSLIGRGAVDVAVAFDDRPANVVTINIR